MACTDHQLSDLHSNTRALKCLLDAMQDNSSKITSDLKSELKRLGRIVENLARNYERLEKQVQDLKQGESSSPTATAQPMYGNIPQAGMIACTCIVVIHNYNYQCTF